MNITVIPHNKIPTIASVHPGVVIKIYNTHYLILEREDTMAKRVPEKNSSYTIPVLCLDTMQLDCLQPDDVRFEIIGELKVTE